MTKVGKINLKIRAILTVRLQSETVVVSLGEEIKLACLQVGRNHNNLFWFRNKNDTKKDDQEIHFQEDLNFFILCMNNQR